MKRRRELEEFEKYVAGYFNNVTVDSFNRYDTPFENDVSRDLRKKINMRIQRVNQLILASGINPTLGITDSIRNFSGPYNFILNIFNLHSFGIEKSQTTLDFIHRAIGVYEDDFRWSVVRTFNPLYYMGLAFKLVARLPFALIETLGFDRTEAESSTWGKMLKGIVVLSSGLLTSLAALQALGWLNHLKQVFKLILGVS